MEVRSFSVLDPTVGRPSYPRDEGKTNSDSTVRTTPTPLPSTRRTCCVLVSVSSPLDLSTPVIWSGGLSVSRPLYVSTVVVCVRPSVRSPRQSFSWILRAPSSSPGDLAGPSRTQPRRLDFERVQELLESGTGRSREESPNW